MPAPRFDRPVRRLVQLYAGLVLFGISMAFFVQARLGVMPWDVLHQGLVRTLARAGVTTTIGQITIVVGVVVLLAWIPLRQMPGIGTISNAIVIGLVVDAALPLLPQPDALAVRIGYVVFALGLNAIASGAYIGARLGPGPRDGLMTGVCGRTGWPVRWVRMAIEIVVVAGGWLLGGNFGPGTIVYALGIGPLVHPLLPRLTVPVSPEPATEPELEPARAPVRSPSQAQPGRATGSATSHLVAPDPQ